MDSRDLHGQIENAVTAHYAWKVKLKTAIHTKQVADTPANVSRDDLCVFGKWLNSTDIDHETRQGMPYRVVKRLHAEFHTIAGSVLRHVESGNLDAAQGIMDGEFTEKSDTLVRALKKWCGEACGDMIQAG